MSDLEDQIRSLVENFTVETDFDYGFGGDLVEVQRIDRQEAYGLIEAFVRPMLERAEKAEALATENGKEICRLRNAVEKAEAEVRDLKSRAILDLSALQEADERAHAAVLSIIADAYTELDRIEEERG